MVIYLFNKMNRFLIHLLSDKNVISVSLLQHFRTLQYSPSLQSQANGDSFTFSIW